MTSRTPGDAPVRVVLVDDQQLVRAGIAFIISTEPGIEVVSEAPNGELGLVAVRDHHPDVVLMGIRMPVMDGITATGRLHDEDGPPVLVLTTFDDDDVLWGALQAGATGFLLKDTPADDLIAAIRSVASGGSWLDQRVRAGAGSGSIASARAAAAMPSTVRARWPDRSQRGIRPRATTLAPVGRAHRWSGALRA